MDVGSWGAITPTSAGGGLQKALALVISHLFPVKIQFFSYQPKRHEQLKFNIIKCDLVVHLSGTLD